MTKHKIKLIGLDLDGTVFNDEKVISEHTIHTIQAAIEQGVIVIPATGRPAAGIPNAFTSIPGVDYAVTSNGASIVNLINNQVLYTDYLSIEDSLILLDILDPYDTLIDIFIEGCAYTNASQMEQLEHYIPSLPLIKYIRATRKTYSCNIKDFILSQGKPVEKIHLLFHDFDIRAAVAETLKPLPFISLTTAYPANLEINTYTANKGNGILKLGELLGISKKEIMVCGDGGNDLAMIQMAGLGVAMGNASEEIKKAADFITKTNEEDGVAYAIEKFVLNRN